MPKENSVRKMAFDMPTNVGPTYGLYVGPTSYQRYMSNMSYVGVTLRHTGWPYDGPMNKLCQRWANGVANQNTPLAQRYHVIWVKPSPLTPPRWVMQMVDDSWDMLLVWVGVAFEILIV